MLYGEAALGLEIGGSICLVLAGTMVFSWFGLGKSSSAGLWWGVLSGACRSWAKSTIRRLSDSNC